MLAVRGARGLSQLYEDLVHAEPGNGSYTLRGSCVCLLLRCRCNKEIVGPSVLVTQRHQIASFMCRRASCNCPSLFLTHYILIWTLCGQTRVSGKHVIDLITHAGMSISGDLKEKKTLTFTCGCTTCKIPDWKTFGVRAPQVQYPALTGPPDAT